jgi:TetR/AcrR family transcriptional regulator
VTLDSSAPSSLAPASGASPGKHQRNAEETKRRLLIAAEIEFAAKGFDGARLGNIARAVGVQQALIHHYFEDKEGLYRAVVERGLAAVADESWDILGRLSGGAGAAQHPKKRRSPFVELVEAFVDMLVRFYATHEALLSIVRHEAGGGGGALSDLLEQRVRPVFDAVVLRLEAMQEAGELKAGVDARHLCISAMAMACFPFQEQALLGALWPADWHSTEMMEARKKEVVATLVARGR